MKIETIAIHAGNQKDETSGAVIQPIVMSTTFVIIYLGIVILLHWGCGPLRQVATLIRELGPAQGRARAAVAETV